MSYNILIVDDSSSMRKVIKKAIRMCNIGHINFSEAENGKVALELLHKEWIDIIFTDINMPVMDGYTFIKELVTQPGFTQTPVIVVTSETRDEEKEKVLELGAKGIVSKPFRPEIVKKMLNEILNIGGSDEEEPDFEGVDF